MINHRRDRGTLSAFPRRIAKEAQGPATHAANAIGMDVRADGKYTCGIGVDAIFEAYM